MNVNFDNLVEDAEVVQGEFHANCFHFQPQQLKALILTYIERDIAQGQEPIAWLHRKGIYTEVSDRELNDEEISIGWTQTPLFTHAQSTPEQIAEITNKQVTLPLNWNKVPESFPPGAETHWFSPKVWLALSDGRVLSGSCLHRTKDAQYDAPIHAWFVDTEDGHNTGLSDDIRVIAWRYGIKRDQESLLELRKSIIPIMNKARMNKS